MTTNTPPPTSARELCALAMIAASDYANAAQWGGVARGLAAHRAGCAIQALAAYAESLERQVAAHEEQAWRGWVG